MIDHRIKLLLAIFGLNLIIGTIFAIGVLTGTYSFGRFITIELAMILGAIQVGIFYCFYQTLHQKPKRAPNQQQG